MKTNFFFLFAVCVLAFTACDDEDLYIGNGTLVTEERFLPVFSGLRVSDDMDAEIIFGDEAEVLLTANENIIDRVRTNVNNQVLEVSMARGNYRDIEISLRIIIPDLHFLRASDDGSISAGAFLDLDELEIRASDGALIELIGTGRQLNIDVSDGSKVRAFDFVSEQCDVRVSDGANVEVDVNERLTGRVSDGGRLFYEGNPSVEVTTSDGGEVIDAN